MQWWRRFWKWPLGAVFVSVFGLDILQAVFSMPGYISDAITWRRWLGVIPDYLVILSWVGLIASISFATSNLWWPRLFPMTAKPSIKAWVAPDGTITITQAAFLWHGVPMQAPLPPIVRDHLTMLQNAIQQGALRMHRRHDKGTEDMFNFVRLVIGNVVLTDTRVLPAELRRWAETIGSIPSFLHDVKPSSEPGK